MTDHADDALMTADQQALLRSVVDAINEAQRPVAPVEITRFLSTRIHPAPALNDITAVVNILELPSVAFQRGEASGIVLARVLDALESATAGEEYRRPTPDVDDGY
ncbi:hypothetical protein [Nocardia niwae]|uniref:hypothetical protein n=1 Tax=Nocardia niwae TaxID=626084 RepID=UPI0007A3AC49|nr:hypothetical protein [Nocardia niwae]